MIKLGSVLGFVFSLTVLFAAYMGTQEASVAEAQPSAALADGCVAEKIALDEGYGVSRVEIRIVCAKKVDDKDARD